MEPGIHFRYWGVGRPIVFVAPWALCSDWWDIPVVSLSERGWRCVTFDRRGHGRSDDPCQGYDFDTLADDIAAILDGLDLQNVVLVGHSMGGAEVVRYLTRYRGHRVTHAVLIAPTTPFTMKTDDNPGGTPREALERTRESFRHDFPHLVAKAAPDFFGVPKNSVSSETMDWWSRQIVDRCSIKVLSELNKIMTETDFRPRASNDPDTYADPTWQHRQIGPAGIDRAPDSRAHRWQPVIGVRRCGTRTAAHTHRSNADGYRRVCASVRTPPSESSTTPTKVQGAHLRPLPILLDNTRCASW